MTAIRTHWLDVDGRPIRVEVAGEGPSIVTIGAAVPIAWSRPAANEFARRGLRSINFDYGPPPGWSGVPERRPCVRQVSDVLAVLEAAASGPVTAVGLSRGAITAYGLASLHPDVVESLVLAFPVAGFSDTIGIEAPAAPAPSEDPMDLLDAALDQAFSPSYLEDNRQVARDLFLAPSGSVVRVDRDEEEVLDELPPVRVPTLVISGGEDRVITVEHPRRLIDAISDVTEVLIADASHGFPMEQPARFCDVVVEFLSRRRPAPR